MWQAITQVLTSPSSVAVLTAIIVILILIGLFAKLGIISFKGKGIRLGKEKNALAERYVLRKQVDFVLSYVHAKEGEIRSIIEENPEGTTEQYNQDPEFYLKWILEKAALHMITNWIMLNNIVEDPVKNTQRSSDLRLYISSLSGNGEYDLKVFGAKINEWGGEILSRLHKIREEMSEHK